MVLFELGLDISLHNRKIRFGNCRRLLRADEALEHDVVAKANLFDEPALGFPFGILTGFVDLRPCYKNIRVTEYGMVHAFMVAHLDWKSTVC